MIWSRLTSLAVLGSALALGACAKDNAADTANTSETAAGTVADPAAPALTDANIVAILDGANVTDSSWGKVASTKGTSAEVRNFGKMMMGEHHALRIAGIDLAKKLNVTPAAPAGDASEQQAKEHAKMLADTPKGAAWDKAYIDHEVQYHEQVLQTATAALNATQTPELRALLQDAAPIVQKHLDRAKEIQAKLAPTS